LTIDRPGDHWIAIAAGGDPDGVPDPLGVNLEIELALAAVRRDVEHLPAPSELGLLQDVCWSVFQGDSAALHFQLGYAGLGLYDGGPLRVIHSRKAVDRPEADAVIVFDCDVVLHHDPV
jgi:hypothetical protein